jgi:hypothetical protein
MLLMLAAALSRFDVIGRHSVSTDGVLFDFQGVKITATVQGTASASAIMFKVGDKMPDNHFIVWVDGKRVAGTCAAAEFPNMDIEGNDIIEPPYKEDDLSACCAACNANDDCMAYSFNGGDGSCYLKRAAGKLTPNDGRISGLAVRAAAASFHTSGWPTGANNTVKIPLFAGLAADTSHEVVIEKSSEPAWNVPMIREPNYVGFVGFEGDAGMSYGGEASPEPHPAAGAATRLSLTTGWLFWLALQIRRRPLQGESSSLGTVSLQVGHKERRCSRGMR